MTAKTGFAENDRIGWGERRKGKRWKESGVLYGIGGDECVVGRVCESEREWCG